MHSPEGQNIEIVSRVGDKQGVGGSSRGKTRNKTEVGQRDYRSSRVRVLGSFALVWFAGGDDAG